MCALFLLTLVGCDQSNQTDTTLAETTVERGPYRLTVAAEPRELRFGDPLTLTLTVTTPPDTVVKFPEMQTLGSFFRTSRTVEPTIANDSGEMIHKAIVKLMPAETGELTINDLSVEYESSQPSQKTTPDPNATTLATNTLLSEPLTINVQSVLTEDDTLEHPRDVTGVMQPATEPNPWFWPVVIAIVLGAGGLIALMIWQIVKQARKPAPPIPADVWALSALDKLAVSEMVRQGQTQAFYYQLSEIVRAYIERQFEIAAAEMTTHEFLVATSRDQQLSRMLDAHTLCEFLDACDLVKYAAFEPGSNAIDEAITKARNFVRESTRAKQQYEQLHPQHLTPNSQEQAA